MRSRADAELLARVRAFSRTAVGLIPLALAAGLVLAVALIERPADLLATAYGRLILIKSLAAAGAFGLGALNKTLVTRVLAENAPKGREVLKMTLAADAVLFSVALTAVAAATTLWPPTA